VFSSETFESVLFTEETFAVENIYLKCTAHLTVWDALVHHSNGTRQARYRLETSQPCKAPSLHSVLHSCQKSHFLLFSQSLSSS